MADKINYPDKSQGVSSTFPADQTWRYQDANEVKATVNANADETDANASALLTKRDLITQLIDVESLSNLPTPSAGVIDLNVPNRTYRFADIIDIGTNRIEITASNVKLCGFFSGSNGILSTTTGVLITSVLSITMEKITLIAPLSTKILDLTNSSTEVVSIQNCVFPSSVSLGTITDYATVFISTCVFENFTSGFVLDGTMDEILIKENLVRDFTGVYLDLNGAVAFAIAVSNHSVRAGSGATFLELAASGANLNSNGQGTIFGNKVDDTGGGVAITGYDSFENKWAVGNNTPNILTSDRLIPNGWGFYVDGETSPATQTFTTTPSKLVIDGLAVVSDEAHLPNSIRGIASLWDTTNNFVLPVTEGDSMTIRIDIQITADSGNPTYIELVGDIGGAAAATIVFIDQIHGVPKNPPFALSVTMGVFAGAIFLANGAQFFINTDTGTVTVGSRAILITRTSSGAA